MKSLSERQMEDLFAPLRAITATDDLHVRVSRLAVQTPREVSRRPLLLLASAFAACLFLAIAFLPRKAVATSFWDRMTQAVDGAKTVHIRYFQYINGQLKPFGETWYADGNWRIERPDETQVYGATKKWLYQPARQVALENPRDLGDFPPEMGGAFSLRSIYAAMNRKGFDFHLSYGSPRNESGRWVVPVTVTRPFHDTERDVFTVDKEKDLPLSGENQILSQKGWEPRMKWVGQYDVAIAPSVFEPTFPAGTRVLNQQAFVEDWKSHLAAPIASAKIDGKPVVIRDTQLNSRGWVFLIWTGEIGGHDYRLSLKDDQGRIFTRAAFNPGMIPSDQGMNKLVYLGDKVVDGAWFVPLEPMVVQRPLHLTLGVSKCVFPPKESHIGYGGTWFRRPFESDSGKAYDGMELDPQIRQVASIQIPAMEPKTERSPQYMALFQDGVSDGGWAEVRALQARMYYWMFRVSRDRRSDPVNRGSVPAITQDGMPIGGNMQFGFIGRPLPRNSDPMVLSRLEDLHKQIIAAEERWRPDGVASAFDWYHLAITQRALGKAEEAQASLEKARVIRPEIRWQFGKG